MDFLVYKKKVLIPNIRLDYTLRYEESTYHMQHAIIHYLLKKNKKKYKMIIKDAKESLFKIQLITSDDAEKKIQQIKSWNIKKIIKYILHNNVDDLYAIKLSGFIRNQIKDKNAFIKRLNLI